jgi:hypothetical protein
MVPALETEKTLNAQKFNCTYASDLGINIIEDIEPYDEPYDEPPILIKKATKS